MRNDPEHCDVAIIGGGLAGLTAASALQKAGADFRILEALSRVGGRIDAVRDEKSGAVLGDLGPTWVWPPYQQSVQRWMQNLGIDSFAQYETGDAVLDLDASATPVRQFLPGQPGMARIAGGPSALVDALVETIDGERVLRNCAVTAIKRSGELFQLQCGESWSITARKVIAAAPLRLMAERIDWSGLLDENTISTMRGAPTWMATQAKVTVQYDEPFWREEKLSGRVASRLGPLVEIHDHCSEDGSTAALFGFVGWPPDMRRQHDLEAAIIQQLVRCFGEQAAEFTRLDIRDWATCPTICSQLDLETVAEHPKRLSESTRLGLCGDRLFFAVAETASESPGLIDGALERGESAAGQVLAA